MNAIRKIQNRYLRAFLQVTVSSIVSLIVYIATFFITGALINDSSSQLFAVVFFVLLLSSIFALVFIFLNYIKTMVGEDRADEDFKDGYPGLFEDIKSLFFVEFPILAVIGAINIASFVIQFADSLIFERATLTAVTVIYAPIIMIGTNFTTSILRMFLPKIVLGIIGFAVSTVIVCAVYLFILALFRRKWYRKNYLGK